MRYEGGPCAYYGLSYALHILGGSRKFYQWD